MRTCLFKREQFLEGRKTDGKKEYNDADLGQQFHLVHTLDQVQAIRSH